MIRFEFEGQTFGLDGEIVIPQNGASTEAQDFLQDVIDSFPRPVYEPDMDAWALRLLPEWGVPVHLLESPPEEFPLPDPDAVF